MKTIKCQAPLKRLTLYKWVKSVLSECITVQLRGKTYEAHHCSTHIKLNEECDCQTKVFLSTKVYGCTFEDAFIKITKPLVLGFIEKHVS